MEYGLLAKHIQAFEGVLAVTVSDIDGKCIAHEDSATPIATASATAWIQKYSARMGELLGLGDQNHVELVWGTSRHVMVGDAALSVCIEYTWPAEPAHLTSEAIALLAAYR